MALHGTNKQPTPRQPKGRQVPARQAVDKARPADTSAKPSVTSTYRTWGLRRRAEPMEVYDPGRHSFIARIRDHLGLELIEVKGEGEPVQVALGQPRDLDDPDANAQRVTPFFSSLESLDYFCRLNLQTYLAVDDQSRLPRRWFWQEAARASRAPSGGGSIVNEATISTRRN